MATHNIETSSAFYCHPNAEHWSFVKHLNMQFSHSLYIYVWEEFEESELPAARLSTFENIYHIL